MQEVSSEAIAGSLEHGSTSNLLLRRRFLVSLLLATWLPILFFVLIAPSADQSTGWAGIKTIFLFLGTAHVPATLFFYTDNEFAAIRKSRPFRYIYGPVLLIVATGLVFAFTSITVQAFALLVFWSWQAFHYGRQNVGIYAFAAIAETGKAPRRTEKWAIEIGTLLGILGTFKILGMAVAPAYLHQTFNVFYQIGFLGFVALIAYSVVVYLKFHQRRTLFTTIFFFTSVLFFFPVFISTDNNIAFLSYAIAHGLQYIVFMIVVSASGVDSRAKSLPLKSLATLLVFLLIVGFAFWRVNDLREIEFVKATWSYARAADFLFGAVLGATMSHFVVDANAWRLSMEKQRAYMAKRFGFVFSRS